MSRPIIPAAVAICAVVAITAPAMAASAAGSDGAGRATRVLPYTAADLYTAAGARRLASRIKFAAASACASSDPLEYMDDGLTICRKEAIDRALGALNAPLVAQALGRSPLSSMAQR